MDVSERNERYLAFDKARNDYERLLSKLKSKYGNDLRFLSCYDRKRLNDAMKEMKMRWKELYSK